MAQDLFRYRVFTGHDEFPSFHVKTKYPGLVKEYSVGKNPVEEKWWYSPEAMVTPSSLLYQ